MAVSHSVGESAGVGAILQTKAVRLSLTAFPSSIHNIAVAELSDSVGKGANTKSDVSTTSGDERGGFF